MNNDYTDVARAIITSARENEYLLDELSLVPELAESERKLFIAMLGEIKKKFAADNNDTGEITEELSADEIVSLFTYVCAKAAESVCAWYLNQDMEFDPDGMFSGKVPLYADEEIVKHFSSLNLAADMANTFAGWSNEHLMLDIDPILPLFEALKWTYRIAAHQTLLLLEDMCRKAGV
ncbi:MAG: hypothetical protein MST10_08435 [Lentisphaeria bacterium]|nr:hypothetical protein [Lentisphaeria bacterium]